MKRLSVLAVFGISLLSACSAGGSQPPVAGAGSPASVLDAYRLPLQTDVRIESAARNGAAQVRSVKNSYGGVPTVNGSAAMTDAPMFGAGARVDLAVVGVDAIDRQHMAYPIVRYDAPVVVNVLDYQHSALQLGSSQIPAIEYAGVELVVDVSKSSVTLGGTTYRMSFGSRSNHVFHPNTDALAGVYYHSKVDASSGAAVSFLMDFNANEWITIKHGVAEVAPKGAATTYQNAAVIIGSVVNHAGLPVKNATVEARAADGSIAAVTTTHDDGSFEIHGVDAGRYQLVVDNLFFPDDADAPLAAIGSDALAPASGPKFDVPAGFRINVGQIAD